MRVSTLLEPAEVVRMHSRVPYSVAAGWPRILSRRPRSLLGISTGSIGVRFQATERGRSRVADCVEIVAHQLKRGGWLDMAKAGPFRNRPSWVQGLDCSATLRLRVSSLWLLGRTKVQLQALEMAKAGPFRNRPSWVQGLDLNQGPSGYEPDELPDCSTLQ